MMKSNFGTGLLVVMGLLIAMTSRAFIMTSNAQGEIRLQKPFDGTYRLTAYVDHQTPLSTNGNMYVYTGEHYINCPDAGTTWTTQGPYCYDGHEGTDWALPGNTPVLAAAPGTVTRARNEGGDIGNAVRIAHGNGYETRYYHLNSFSVDVGDQVIAGQQIALSGNSGNDQPYHLHFGVYYNNAVTDPFGWRGSGSDPISGGPAVCLWGDGQCSEFVVEDRSSGYYEYGVGWQWWHGGNSWTMRYVSNKQFNSVASAIWTPNLPHSGPYSIFAFIPSQHSTTQNARYTIQPYPVVLPTVAVDVNQQNFSDDWVHLGNYELYAGSSNVTLTDKTGEADNMKQVGFDAIKFYQTEVHLPEIRSGYNGWDSAFYIHNNGDHVTIPSPINGC